MLNEGAVLIDYKCRQPVTFRSGHSLLPPRHRSRWGMGPTAMRIPNLFADEDTPPALRLMVGWAVVACYPDIRLRAASSSAVFMAARALAQAWSSGSARKAALKGSAWTGPS